MTTPEGLPAWLYVGAEVGTYTDTAGSARESTIARFTKTLVILDNGDRFPLKDISPTADCAYRRAGGYRGWNVYLVPRDSDKWRRVTAKHEQATRRHEAWSAVEAWQRRPSDETARAAITALEATLTTTETPS